MNEPPCTHHPDSRSSMFWYSCPHVAFFRALNLLHHLPQCYSATSHLPKESCREPKSSLHLIKYENKREPTY